MRHQSIKRAGVEPATGQEWASKDEAGVTFEFAEPRSATSALTMFEAAIFAVARSMIDWNVRNKVSPTTLR